MEIKTIQKISKLMYKENVFYNNNVLKIKNKDGSAVYISYFSNGAIKSKFFKNKYDKSHKLDGPAIFLYYQNGNIETEEYRINGNLHRQDGPAVTIHSEDGTPYYQSWYINGDLHREDGPAIIDKKSGKTKKEFYLNGQKVKPFKTKGP